MEVPMPLGPNDVAARLARFETERGTKAPRPYFDPQVAPTSTFLRYAEETGLIQAVTP